MPAMHIGMIEPPAASRAVGSEQVGASRPDEVICPGCGHTHRVRDARLTDTVRPLRSLGKFQLKLLRFAFICVHHPHLWQFSICLFWDGLP